MNLFKRLLKRFRKKAEADAISPLVPVGQRIYCVGDIHGCVDLLHDLHERILKDATKDKGQKVIVYLGDYIDRGENSSQVIELLLSEPLTDFTSIYLRGNHEQLMLDFLAEPQAAASWMSYGGREALNSYGIPMGHIPTAKELPELAKKLEDKLPSRHLTFLQESASSWQCGHYYFVHAGIRPGIALEKQQIKDQLWIRSDFLSSDKNHGAIIVHGHSISSEPQVLPNRIGIDTGAYASGVLSCLVLEGREQRFLQTGKKDGG